MEEQGLAATMGGQSQISGDIVKQVMQMLMAGATEAELLQMGIPKEVIDAAIVQLSSRPQIDESAGLAAQQQLI